MQAGRKSRYPEEFGINLQGLIEKLIPKIIACHVHPTGTVSCLPDIQTAIDTKIEIIQFIFYKFEFFLLSIESKFGTRNIFEGF